MYRYSKILGIFCIASLGILNVNAQLSAIHKKVPTSESSFKYVIVSDKLDPKISKNDEDRRFVEVLMDKNSFSKENLITLFHLVSKRIPKPSLLNIDVFTDLNDVETPEERELSRFSDSSKEKKLGDNAIFIRNERKMFFYIYFADGNFDKIEMK